MTEVARRSIGHFEVLGVLGQGGMGVVYRARDTRDGASVALKTLFSRSKIEVAAIRREIDALRRIRHRGVVSIVDDGLEQGVPWYAMELLESRTLTTLLVEAGRSSEPPPATGTRALARPAARSPRLVKPGETVAVADLVDVIRRICVPLGFVHGEGVVHGDLKPDNIFFRDTLEPVLVDFGLVRHVASTSRDALEVLTDPYSGTLPYMSPEHLGDGEVDPRSDIYSLGCILYEMIVGRPPFGGSAAQIRDGHASGPPTPPSNHVHDVPRGLDEIVLRMLETSPSDRFGYASDVARALAPFGTGAADTVFEDAPPARDYLYRPPFVGRDDALDRVELWRESEGPILYLHGEQGIGKTRALAEVALEAVEDGQKVVSCACSPTSTIVSAAPFHAFSGAFRAVADHCRAQGPEETARVLGSRGALLAQYAPFLAELDGFEAAPVQPLESHDAARQRLYAWFAKTLSAMAEQEPLLLLMDDCQWADELSRGFLDGVQAGGVEMPGVKVVATTRQALESHAGGERVDHVAIPPLARQEVATLASDMLALPRAPDVLVSRLVEVSEGSPFYISEYLHAAVELGVLQRDDLGRWHIDAERVGRLPSTVLELHRVRVTGLSAEVRAALEQISAFHGAVALPILQNALSSNESENLLAVGELLARQLIESEGEAIKFARAELSDAIYEALDGDRRRELHLGAAHSIEAMDPENHRSLATQWYAAGELVKAQRSSVEAALQAYALAAPTEACRWFERAFELEQQGVGQIAEGIERGRILATFARARFGMGDVAAADALVREALTLLRVRIPNPSSKWGGRVLWEAFRQTAHRWWTPRASEDDAERIEVALDALGLIAHVFLAKSDTMGQLGATLLSANLADAVEGRGAGDSYASLSVALGIMGAEGVAGKYLSRAHALTPDPGDARNIYKSEALLCLCRAKWDRLQEAVVAGVTASEAAGDHQNLAQIALFQAAAMTLQGLATQALDTTENMLRRIEKLGYRLEATHLLCHQAIALLHKREAERAEEVMRRAAETIAGVEDPVGAVFVPTIQAAVCLVAGRIDEGWTAVNEAFDELERAPAGSPGFIVPTMFLAPVFLGVHDQLSDESRRHEAIAKTRSLVKRLKALGRMQPAARPSALLFEGAIARRLGKNDRAARKLRAAQQLATNMSLKWVSAAAAWETNAIPSHASDDGFSQAMTTLTELGCVRAPFYFADATAE